MRKLYVFMILAFLSYSCSEDDPERNVSVPEKTEYSGENIEEDTLITAGREDITQTDTSTAFEVSGKAIVFFMPSEKEFQEIVEKEGEESGISEVVSDFTYYANEVSDSLKKGSDIKIFFTNNPVVKVSYNSKSTIVDRRKLDHMVGAVFTDGKKEPQVNTGVYTDIDYWQMIGEYFEK